MLKNFWNFTNISINRSKSDKNKRRSKKSLLKALQFYFITDYDVVDTLSINNQVRIAIKSGVGTIQYRNKNFSLNYYSEASKVRDLCYKNDVLFVVNDDVLLAKAINADGIHLGQNDESLILVRKILGPDAILGLSISRLNELNKSDPSYCDYIGVGPVFSTKTKPDANPPQGIGVDLLSKIVQKSLVPVVAIGGIKSTNAKICIECGVDGIAVVSSISRSKDPVKSAAQLARICFNSF